MLTRPIITAIAEEIWRRSTVWLWDIVVAHLFSGHKNGVSWQKKSALLYLKHEGLDTMRSFRPVMHRISILSVEESVPQLFSWRFNTARTEQDKNDFIGEIDWRDP